MVGRGIRLDKIGTRLLDLGLVWKNWGMKVDKGSLGKGQKGAVNANFGRLCVFMSNGYDRDIILGHEGHGHG